MLLGRKSPPDWRERTRVAVWPRRSWRRSFAYWRHRVLRLGASPHAIAAGVAAGVFASCTPLVGFHFILGFVVAWLIGGNLVASAIGTAAGNPLTFPFIWVTSFQIGVLVTGGEAPATHPLDLELGPGLFMSSFAALWPTFRPMLVGGVILGLLAGGIGYVLVRSAVAASQAIRRERTRAARPAVAGAIAEGGDGGPRTTTERTG